MTFEQQRNYFQDQVRFLKPNNFDKLTLELYSFQAQYNPLYGEFLSLLGSKEKEIKDINQIPFLPISFFKNKEIKTGEWQKESLFESSGTTNQITSQHEVRSINWYKENTVKAFQEFYGNPKDFCFLALLPAYLERTGSSLVLMADHFIKCSNYEESGFFLEDHEQLLSRLHFLKEENIPTVLLGVSFGLLDFVEKYHIEFPNLIVMETGGMKGRRKEITRSELHQPLKTGFGVSKIHSEYGMTELFSQAYSKGEGRFKTASTMKVLLRDVTDPFTILKKERHGAINIIDLANIDTCAFIATDDLGRKFADNTFEILGRLDASDIRGCNLMVGEE